MLKTTYEHVYVRHVRPWFDVTENSGQWPPENIDKYQKLPAK